MPNEAGEKASAVQAVVVEWYVRRPRLCSRTELRKHKQSNSGIRYASACLLWIICVSGWLPLNSARSDSVCCAVNPNPNGIISRLPLEEIPEFRAFDCLKWWTPDWTNSLWIFRQLLRRNAYTIPTLVVNPNLNGIISRLLGYGRISAAFF